MFNDAIKHGTCVIHMCVPFCYRSVLPRVFIPHWYLAKGKGGGGWLEWLLGEYGKFLTDQEKVCNHYLLTYILCFALHVGPLSTVKPVMSHTCVTLHKFISTPSMQVYIICFVKSCVIQPQTDIAVYRASFSVYGCLHRFQIVKFNWLFLWLHRNISQCFSVLWLTFLWMVINA